MGQGIFGFVLVFAGIAGAAYYMFKSSSVPEGLTRSDDGCPIVNWGLDEQLKRDQIAYLSKVLEPGDKYYVKSGVEGGGMLLTMYWDQQSEAVGKSYIESGLTTQGSGGIVDSIDQLIARVGSFFPWFVVILILLLVLMSKRSRG